MKRILTITALGLALTTASATAAVITPYTTSGAFLSALSGGDANGTYSSSVTELFNGSVSVFTNISLTGGAQGGYTRGVTVLNNFLDQVDQSPLQTTTINRTGGVLIKAVGANWDLAESGAGTNVTLTLNFDGSTQTLTYVLGGNTGIAGGAFYFGFTSDTPFVSFTLSSANANLNSSSAETFTFDNLTTAAAGTPPPPAVPEPATFGLMGAALVGLGLVRKFRS